MTTKPGVNPPSTQRRPYKRRARNIIIHRPMQREFLLVLTALLGISLFAIAFIIHDMIREAAFGGGLRFGKINPYEVLYEVRYQLILKVSCVLFVAIVIIGLFAVFFLHRVAGPVHRFRQILFKLNQGQIPSPIKLREGDFFNELAQDINDLVELLGGEGKKQQAMKEKIDQILSSNPPEPIRKQVQDVKSFLESPPSRS